MSSTSVGRLTDPVAVREDVRGEVAHASGRIPDVGPGVPSAVLAMHPPIQWVGVTKRTIETELVSSEGEALQDQALRDVTVPLCLEWFDGRIRTIQLVVIDLDETTEEIRLDGRTIGFIGRAGAIFVAQTGTRLDRAEECGQCLVWDTAATILVTLLGNRVEPEKPDLRVGAPEDTTGRHDGDTGRAPNGQHQRVHEMSRSGGQKW